MTELYSKAERDSNLVGVDAINALLKQFKKLQHLSDHDVSFRMVLSMSEVRKFRKHFRQLERPLYDTKIDYSVRVILGANGIKNTGQLLALSDEELLAMEGIGKIRLEALREAVRELFA